MKTVVCWILTEDDDRSDGMRTRYLSKPEIWQGYDKDVFDHLKEQVIDLGKREVSCIQDPRILPNMRFFNEPMRDGLYERKNFFTRLLEFSKDADLIFYDPDNGLEIKSVRLGKTKSSKYVYWEEIKATFNRGSSVLIYQHYPRVNRDKFIESMLWKVRKNIDLATVFSYSTFHVLFLLISQPTHETQFKLYNKNLSKRWNKLIRIEDHGYA